MDEIKSKFVRESLIILIIRESEWNQFITNKKFLLKIVLVHEN